jgi:hypothetical protein
MEVDSQPSEISPNETSVIAPVGTTSGSENDLGPLSDDDKTPPKRKVLKKTKKSPAKKGVQKARSPARKNKTLKSKATNKQKTKKSTLDSDSLKAALGSRDGELRRALINYLFER